MPHLKQCLGVDLGFHSVKIVELALDKSGARAVRAATVPTGASPAMSAEEVGQAIISAAKEAIKKGRFGTRKAVFAISGQKVFVRRFRLPKTSEERLARMIQYEARQQIPFPLDKTILQYQHRELPEEGEVEVLLVAVRSDEIKSYMQLVNKVGLTPMAVGVSSFALFSSHQFIHLDEAGQKKLFEKKKGGKTKKASKGGLSFLKKKKGAEEQAPVAVEEEGGEDEFVIEEVRGYINLGATSYDLAIGRSTGSAGSIGFIRTVPTGGNEMSKAIMRQCGVESFTDAERIKTSSTQLMTFQFDFEEEQTVNQDASMAVTEVADKIVSEIRRSLDFYITQPDGMAIDSVVLSGGQALLPGIDSYLEEKLTIPVSISKELPDNTPLRWQDSFGAITTYTIAIGLGLQGMGLAAIDVDFLPEDRKITRDFPYRVAAVMLFLVGATAAISSQAGKDYQTKFNASMQNLQAEIVRVKEKSKAFTEAQETHDEVAEKFLALDKSFGQRDFWMDVLERVAEVKPVGILLLDVELDHAGQVSIQAQSDVQVDAPEFNTALKEAFGDRLKSDPIIEDVVSGTPPPGGGQPPSNFTIKLNFADKINHLKITPTPTPEPAGGRMGQGFEGFMDPMMGGNRQGQQQQRRQPEQRRNNRLF